MYRRIGTLESRSDRRARCAGEAESFRVKGGVMNLRRRGVKLNNPTGLKSFERVRVVFTSNLGCGAGIGI